jgi:hypothetical protein
VRPILALPFALGLLACIQQPATGADGGVTTDGGEGALVDGGAAGPQAQGLDCITEPSTGLKICTGISVCPKVLVDHDVYPNCGFRIRGTALDLECACSGQICPLGTPSTCDQAATMLQNQTEAIVCQQINEGRCAAGTPTETTGSTSSGGSSCDKACAGECAGDVNCVRLCGC